MDKTVKITLMLVSVLLLVIVVSGIRTAFRIDSKLEDRITNTEEEQSVLTKARTHNYKQQNSSGADDSFSFKKAMVSFSRQSDFIPKKKEIKVRNKDAGEKQVSKTASIMPEEAVIPDAPIFTYQEDFNNN